MRERAAVLLALMALVVAGCGDDEEASQTIPPLPELTVPGEGTPTLDDLPSTTGTDTGPSTDGGAGSPSTPPAGGDTGTPQGGGAPSGGQAAPQDTPDNDTPPPAGSPAERFEEFCSENPGTC